MDGNNNDIWRVWVCFYLSLISTMLAVTSAHEAYFSSLYAGNNTILYLASLAVVLSIVYMHIKFSSKSSAHLKLGIAIFSASSAWLCTVLYMWFLSGTQSEVPISCAIFVLCIFIISSVLEYSHGNDADETQAVSLPSSKAHVQGVVNSLIFGTISVMVCWGLLLVINDKNMWDWSYMRGELLLDVS